MTEFKPVKMAKRIKPTLWANIKEICTRWSIGGNKLVMPHVMLVRLIAYPFAMGFLLLAALMIWLAWGKEEAKDLIADYF